MSAAELLGALRARGVELVAAGDRLRFRPVAAVTLDELAALRVQKAAVLSLLRAETSAASNDNDSWADGVPDSACGLCRSPLAWVEDWPAAGAARWRCLACAARLVPTLADAHAGLTEPERQQLRTEAAAGDPLA